MNKIAYVIPCYNSANTIASVVEEIISTMKGLTYEYEVILVNDSSPDDTYNVIKELALTRNYVTAVNLAKNFGQHAAIMAGFSCVKEDADLVCCLDDDGQTPADEVEKLISAINRGYDVVYAKYSTKEHSKFRNIGSRINSIMASYLIGKPKNLYVSSYFVAKKYVIDKVREYEHSYPYLIGLILRTTNNITNVEVKHRSRLVGESGYTLSKLIGLWMNGFTAFSIKPLRIATVLGFVSAVFGFFYAVYTIINKLVNKNVLLGWSSTVASIYFVGGLILIVLGMIGEYIGRIYISINSAPQFVIKEVEKGKENEAS